MGPFGIFYFLILLVTIIVFVLAIFRAIATYIMAVLAVAVLTGLAPLFLTFMLFEKTKGMFDTWIQYTIRYMIEPLILLLGLTMLTNLFTIYFDNAFNYSVCWKCALGFKIPFSLGVAALDKFLDTPIFCLNWFAPWGLDPSGDLMGITMTDIVALTIITYCISGYIDISAAISENIVGGAPSPSEMGKAMVGAVGQKALGKVGLDEKTRNRKIGQLKKRMAERRESVKKALKNQRKSSPNAIQNQQGAAKPAQGAAKFQQPQWQNSGSKKP